LLPQPLEKSAIEDRASGVLREHMSEASFARLVALVDSASRRELPTAPIIDRAVQGARRRLSDDVIIRAAGVMADRLAAARGALGRESTTDELTAGAEALFAGVTPAALVQLRTHRPYGDAVVPLIVLTDLVSNGVPAGDATATVLSFVDRRNANHVAVSDETMLTIRAEVAADVARGAPPTTALSSRVRSHTQGPQRFNNPSATAPPRPSPKTRPPGGL
jgi:hypothetical protein